MTDGEDKGHLIKERIVLWAAMASSISLLAYSVFLVSFFSFANFLILAAASSVAVLIGRFRISVPLTEIEVRPKTIVTFWGAIWLGPPGAALLAAVSSFAEQTPEMRRDRSSLFELSADIIAAFAAAIVYAHAYDNFTSQAASIALGGPLVPNGVLIATIVMAAAHFGIRAAVKLFNDGLAAETDGSTSAADEIARLAKGYSIHILATLVLCVVFRYFGIEIGLVIIPITLVANIGYKIHNRSLEQKTRQISEASRMHLATVEALATAIDARDQVGVGHVRRTQIYAVGIGNALRLSEDEISALRTGALLHDIGKLAVPDHILNKPGRLTPAEMEKTKIHSSVGASILEKVGFPYPVVPTVKYHHEFWNGAGYPEGLKGTNIPVTARILTIADTYDTLRGDRPYRRAIPRDEACEFLRSRSGTQFDPAIVEVFLRNLRVYEEEIESAGLSYDATAGPQFSNTMEASRSEVPNYVEQIKRANHEVFTLFSLAREFSGSLNLLETLTLFTKKIAEFVPYDTCIVFLMEDSGESATAAFAAGKHEATLHGKRIMVGEGATGYVLKTRKQVENIDPALDFAFAEAGLGKDFTAMTSLPLLADNKLVGAISLYSCELESYQDEHLRLLETVSRIAADAIEKALKHAEAQVYALTDPMTGLPNSRSLQIEFDKEVMRAGRSGTSFQLLVLDLDGFKSVNDTFGHKVGDNMLREIARVIREQLREYDFLARYGGDEFVAIVPETDTAFVERLRYRIEDAVTGFSLPVGDGAFARVGISFGSASFPTQGESFDALIVAADKAMYRSKAINRLRNMPIAVGGDETDEQMIDAPHVEIIEASVEDHPIDKPDIDAEPLIDEDAVAIEVDDDHVIALATIT